METDDNHKISFYVITKNEEKNIERCLQSVRDIVDEIIAVDSYSADKTVEVIKKFGAKIFTKKFNDNLSEQRNFAIGKARYDWILTIDADEVLSPELKKEIPKLIQKKDVDGFWFSRRHYITDDKYLKHGYFYPDYQLRLFRSHKNYSYSGRLHEQLNIPKNKTRYITLDIDHFAKNPKYNSLFSIFKIGWYVKLQSYEYLDQKKPAFYYLLLGIFYFPYHFIGSFLRGGGYRDRYFGFTAAIVFAYSISAAYLYAAYQKLASKNDLVSNK